MATICGRASTPSFPKKGKMLWREVYMVSSAPGGSQPLKWSSTPVTFDWSDHPSNTVGVGLLPVVVTLTICNIGVKQVLMDVRAGLNLLLAPSNITAWTG